MSRSKRFGPPTDLLSLPLEIRIQIYDNVFEYLTSAQFEISIDVDKYASSNAGQLVPQCSRQPKCHLSLAILRCNKQIYREALPAWYNRCVFFPLADEVVIATFFGRMSDFARSNIRKIHLRPRPQKIIRRVGPQATISELLRAPSWTSTCDTISILFVALEEVYIHLHPMYGVDLGRGNGLDWIIRPLSRLRGTKKTLASIGSGSQNTKTAELVGIWNELVEKANTEAEEYTACKNRIMEGRVNWSNPYWMMKRSKLQNTQGST